MAGYGAPYASPPPPSPYGMAPPSPYLQSPQGYYGGYAEGPRQYYAATPLPPPSPSPYTTEPASIGYSTGGHRHEPRLLAATDKPAGVRQAWAGHLTGHHGAGHGLPVERGRWSVMNLFGGGVGQHAAPPPHPALPSRLRVTAITWNMNMGGGSFEDLAQQLVAEAAGTVESVFSTPHAGEAGLRPDRDIYVVGTQEAPLSGRGAVQWEDALNAALGAAEFAKLDAVRLDPGGWIHIVVFVRRSLLPVMSDVSVGAVATGVAGMIGNKGGVAIAFSIGSARLVFINAHFAAHTAAVEARNADYERIAAEFFSRTGPLSRTRDGLPVADSRLTDEENEEGKRFAAEAGCCSLSAAPRFTPAQVTRRPGAAPALAGDAFRHRYDLEHYAAVAARQSRAMQYQPQQSPGAMALGLDVMALHGGGDISGAGPLRRSYVGSMPSPLASTPADNNWRGNAATTFAAERRAAEARPLPGRDLGDFDAVVWMGDLNYRIVGPRKLIDTQLQSAAWPALWAADQLTTERRKGHIFPGFEEAVTNFPPTYKMDPGTDAYDSSSKQRVPAWTDRVLYASPDGLAHLLRYAGLLRPRASDHKAVAATLEILMPAKRVRHGGAGASETDERRQPRCCG